MHVVNPKICVCSFVYVASVMIIVLIGVLITYLI